MSVENNSARSIDGLNTISVDVINVVDSIEINGDNGIENQLLSSTGTTTIWKSLADLLLNLTATAPLSFVSGTNYNGSVARALTIADGTIANVKLANSTISGKELGTNLETLNFDAPLSNLDYNGGTARTITIADDAIGNAKLDNSTISGIELGSNLANLSGGSGITMTAYNGATARSIALTENSISGIALGSNLATLNFDAPLSNFDYNGGTTRTITIADDAIGNVKLDNSTISGIELGSNLANLTGGSGITMTAYNGATARSIALTQNTITIGATGVALGATATNIDMSGGNIEDAVVIGTDLIDEDNVFLPANVYYIGSGIYHMPFNAGVFHSNDDHGTANYAISDSGAKINGRGIIMSTSLELCGFATIPRGWSATGSMIDVRDSGGNILSSSIPSYNIEKVFTYRIEGGSPAKIPDSVPLYSGSGVSVGTEHAFSGDVSVAAAIAETLLIVVNMTSSTHFIGGGYITITPP